MEIMRKNIAMRCTEAQFKAVESKLEVPNDINEWSEILCYLVNKRRMDFSGVNLYSIMSFEAHEDYEIHEEWNEKVFLEACGISVIPTLEEVKEYFKDAEKVKSGLLGVKFKMDGEIRKSKYTYDEAYYHEAKDGFISVVWGPKKGYAKILTYKKPKEETFEITKEQIKDLANQWDENEITLKEWFPKAFEEDKVEFVNGYYKHKNEKHLYWFWYCNFETLENYGRDSVGKWQGSFTDMHEYIKDCCEPMTHQEVEEALKKEAVKRYKVGDYISRPFDDELKDVVIDPTTFILDEEYTYCEINDYLEFHGFVVYSKGQWAAIIPTKTRQEAEKELNCKIVD